MKRKDLKKIISIASVLVVLICGYLYAGTYPFKTVYSPMVKDENHKYKEKHYVQAYCKGQIEYRLPDKTRVDCLTDEYAIEFDYGNKWAEGIGQSLYYAKKTGKKPAIALILRSEKDNKYIERINAVDKNIKVFPIKAYQD
ncbi:MAG: hypothetical protein Q4E87_03005 [bacterium]|nr:hypothetical protein [bacterium]